MVRLFCILLAVFFLSACGIDTAPEDLSVPPTQVVVSDQDAAQAQQSGEVTLNQEEAALKITVGAYELMATFEENSSAEEFKELLSQGPLSIEMEDYGGFEKVGFLSRNLTRNDNYITTEPGDVILYQGNQITIYYGVNSWNLTRLAKIDDPTELKAKLGDGTVQVTFSLE